MNKRKKNKRPNRASSTNSTQNKSVPDVGDISQREDAKDWKSRIREFFLPIIGSIIGGLVLFILTNGLSTKDDEILKAKAIINENIVRIEESFDPNAIKADALSSPDLKMVQDFQTHAKNLVKQWRTMCNARPIEEFERFDLGTLKKVANSQDSVRHIYADEVRAINVCMDSLKKYGEEHNIDCYKPGTDRHVWLKNFESQSGVSCIDNHMKSDWSDQVDPPQDTAKAKKTIINSLKEKDETYNSKTALDNVKTLLIYVIELNEKYMMQVNNDKIDDE